MKKQNGRSSVEMKAKILIFEDDTIIRSALRPLVESFDSNKVESLHGS